MPEFIMEGCLHPAFQALDEFTQGYIECAFFTATRKGESGDESAFGFELDETSGFEDLSSESLAQTMRACENFQHNHQNYKAIETILSEGAYDLRQIGRDFWFTRNGHGVGYWSRMEENPVTEPVYRALAVLNDACDGWPELSLYLGDDGLIYLEGV